MKALKNLSRFALVSLSLILASCSDDDNGTPNPPEADVTIVEAAKQPPN